MATDAGRSNDLRTDKREGANSAGGLVQEELRWKQRWSLRLAVRYDNLRYISEDHIHPALNAGKNFTHWTPKGSLAYGFDHHTVFAALGGGVESPAFNEIDPPPSFDTLTSLNPFLEAMRSTTYELGTGGEVSGAWTGRRLDYEAALYQIDIANDIVPFDGGAYFFTAGKSRRRGFELGLDWQAMDALSLDVALTLSDNQYITYRNDLGDFGGNDVPGLPKVVFNGEARYSLPAGVTLGLSLERVGDYFADDANTARAAAHALVGATAAYQRKTRLGTLRAFLAGENLTDERYVASLFINGVNGEFYEPGLPRSWSAGLTLRWQ